ncbi:recombinase family protein [Lachnotalea glycerini]|nr:recombinase family protein [Lachnotalea glycerini]
MSKLNLNGNYCMYLRKSRADTEAEMHGEGETLARHRTILMSTAKMLHINITKQYEEVVSGETIASRPVMQQLLIDIENGDWNGVLVVEVERLARGDTIDQGIMAQAFKFSNTKIITPSKTYDPNNEFDEEYFEFGLFMSRREYKTINRRLQAGRMSSINEGKWVSNKAPYGFERVKLDNEKGFTLSPIQSQADIVKMIFNLYAYGEDGENRIGVSLICRKLNQLNVPTATGNREWLPCVINGILRNPTYIGKIRWNSRKTVKQSVNGVVTKTRPRNQNKDCTIVDGLHPAIIEEDLFNKVQDLLSYNPPRPVNTRNKIANPLAGLVVCGNCNRNMVRRPYNNHTHADTIICPYPECATVASNLSMVEDAIIEHMQQLVKDYELNESVNNYDSSENNISVKINLLNKHKGEFQKLNKQKNSLYDLLEQGIYSNEEFTERSQLIKNRINETIKLIDSLEQKIADEQLREKKVSVFIPKCKNLLDSYYDLNAASKNSLLKELITKVVYTKNVKNKRGEGNIPTFELTIYTNIIT